MGQRRRSLLYFLSVRSAGDMDGYLNVSQARDRRSLEEPRGVLLRKALSAKNGSPTPPTPKPAEPRTTAQRRIRARHKPNAQSPFGTGIGSGKQSRPPSQGPLPRTPEGQQQGIRRSVTRGSASRRRHRLSSSPKKVASVSRSPRIEDPPQRSAPRFPAQPRRGTAQRPFRAAFPRQTPKSFRAQLSPQRSVPIFYSSSAPFRRRCPPHPPPSRRRVGVFPCSLIPRSPRTTLHNSLPSPAAPGSPRRPRTPCCRSPCRSGGVGSARGSRAMSRGSRGGIGAT